MLDQALDQPVEEVGEEGVGAWDFGMEINFGLTDFDDYANFELLDGFDWIGEPWWRSGFRSTSGMAVMRVKVLEFPSPYNASVMIMEIQLSFELH